MKKHNISLLFICIAVAIITIVAVPIIINTEDIGFNNEEAREFNDHWQILKSDDSYEDIQIPTIIDYPAGQDLVLKNTIPDDLDGGECFAIRNDVQSLKVLIDNNITYECGTDKSRFLGDTIGSIWNIVPIKQMYQGKDITFIINAPNKQQSGYINEVYFGSKSALIFKILSKKLVALYSSLFILFIGFSLIVLTIILKVLKNNFYSLLFLALFTFFNGFWLLSETQAIQLFTGNQVLITTISYYSLIFIPIPFIMYIQSDCSFKKKNKLNLLIYAAFANFLYNTIFYYLDIGNFFSRVFISHIIIVFVVGYIIILLLFEYIKHKNKNIKGHLFSFIFLFLGVIAEIGYFYLNNYNCNLMFLSISSLIFICNLTYLAFKKSKDYKRVVREKKYYEKLAYYDTLTLGYNRTAYYTDCKMIEEEDFENIYIVQFDVNDLKKVNDSFGHHYGDNLIKEAYRCINSTFGGMGKCYRIGGDEFTCIIKNSDIIHIKDTLDDFYLKLNVLNKELKQPISISVGYTKYDKSIDTCFEDACCRADKLMYFNKQDIKNKEGIETANYFL